MIDKIKHIFINETTNDLCLLKQGLNQPTFSKSFNEIVEMVFRTMHNIKGSGAMFGFNSLTEVTLPVEQTYRNLRDGKGHIDEIIIKKTKDVVAHLEVVLNSKDGHLPNCKDEKEALIEFFNNINRLNERTND